MTERTVRWRGGVAAAILLAVAGLAAGDGTLVLAAAIPLAYVAYGSVSAVAVPGDLRAERTVEPTNAPPGRAVRVTLTVTNGSDRTLSDVRVVDGVPADLAVVDGTPRVGATLAPGESCTAEYVVVARRGTYGFASPRVRLRNVGAGAVDTTTVDPAGDAELVCRLDSEAPPLDDEGNAAAGQLAGDRPGDGVAFHSTREYRAGDPAGRIDWRQYAKRNELATVNYERQVAATVVLVLDARPPSRVVAGPGRPTGVELSAYAATRALADLLRTGHDVAVAVVGLDGPGPDGLHWLPPGGGQEQRARALELFRAATDDAPANDGDGAVERSVAELLGRADPGAGPESSGPEPAGPDVDAQVASVAQVAPAGSQLALCSPLVDDGPVDAVEAWAALDHPLVVLSPDVVPDNTVGGGLAAVRRHTRLARCQAAGARTIDWRRGTPLPLAVAHAFAVQDRLANRAASASGGGR